MSHPDHPLSSKALMMKTLSSAGYDSTLIEKLKGDNLGCATCGNERGMLGGAITHRCCYCADGGRVRIGNGQTDVCPRCTGTSATPPPENPERRMHIPWKYRDVTFASWKPDNGGERLRCQSYAAVWPPEKPLMFLTGNRGTGKTTLAVAILRTVFDRHAANGQFWLVQRLLDRINATYDDEAEETLQQVMSQMEKVPLLVLDDLGSEKSTEAARSRLFAIIDHRYSNGLPLVVTSNAAPQELDPRIKSRLSDAAVCTLVPFTGRDMCPEATQ